MISIQTKLVNSCKWIVIASIFHIPSHPFSSDSDDEKKDKAKKKVPNWLHQTDYRGKRKKKRRKGKRSDVYSVSDAMSKHLLADTGQEKTTCAECERCRLNEYNMQHQMTSSNLNGAHLWSKTTQTSNKTDRSPSCNRVMRPLRNALEEEKAVNGGQPSRKRAHSSPEITVTTLLPKSTACTCARPRQNGGNVVHCAERLREAPADRDDKVTLVKFCEIDCERTSENAAEDDVHFEEETRNKTTLKTKVPCSGPKTNGNVARPLHDASIRLESQPDVTISIFAESVM